MNSGSALSCAFRQWFKLGLASKYCRVRLPKIENHYHFNHNCYNGFVEMGRDLLLAASIPTTRPCDGDAGERARVRALELELPMTGSKSTRGVRQRRRHPQFEIGGR